MHTTATTLPKPPYITPDANKVTYWKNKIARDKNFKIGLCWQSGSDTGYVPQGRRSIKLSEFAPLSTLKGVSFYCLQKGNDAVAQLTALPKQFKIIDFGSAFDNGGAFTDTAALMLNLDLVISIDTSVAHLAGALAVPVWTLLPLHPDSRWTHKGTTTVWYPTMRLFRQTKVGDWQSVIKQVRETLQQTIKNK
jgi:hypothetical protein